TRPASRRVVSAVAPFSSGSASARTAAISSRSEKRFGDAMTRESTHAGAGLSHLAVVHDEARPSAGLAESRGGSAIRVGHGSREGHAYVTAAVTEPWHSQPGAWPGPGTGFAPPRACRGLGGEPNSQPVAPRARTDITRMTS